MSWQDLPIYSRNDGSFIISYNNAPLCVGLDNSGWWFIIRVRIGF